MVMEFENSSFSSFLSVISRKTVKNLTVIFIFSVFLSVDGLVDCFLYCVTVTIH